MTLADEDTNSILTDNANRAIQGNVAMHVLNGASLTTLIKLLLTDRFSMWKTWIRVILGNKSVSRACKPETSPLLPCRKPYWVDGH